MKSANAKPYYGWYVAVTLALTETISWGIIYYAFTLFLAPMEVDLGWTRAQLTGGLTLMLLVAGVMAYPFGAWIDKHGARLLMTMGSICASLLVIAWSQVTTVPAFYVIWIGLGICGAAVLYEPAFAVIAQWFHRKRGTALAVVTFAAGLASTIFLPLCDVLLRSYGWRTSVLILGLFLGCITVPLHFLVLRRHPSDLGLLPDGAVKSAGETVVLPSGISFRDAVRGRAFWMLTLSFGLIYVSASAIRIHFIPFLIGSGVTSSTAAFATGAIGITQVVGRVVFAPLDQRFSSRIIAVVVFGLQALSIAFLLPGSSMLTIGVFILIFGAAQGAITLARPSLLAELYGVSHYGRISSVMSIVLTLASTGAPLAASLLYDQTGNYQMVLWIVFILAVAATGVVLFAQRDLIRLSRHDTMLVSLPSPETSSEGATD